MYRSQRLRGMLATVLMATCVGGAWGQQATRPLAVAQKVSLDIPSQPVAGALTALGQQSGLTIMLAAAAKTDAVSPAVVGTYTPDEALQKILATTGLKAEYLDQKTVAVRIAQSDSKNAKRSATDAAQTKATETKAPATSTADPQQETPEKHTNGSETLPETSAEPVDREKRKIPEILIKGSRIMNVDVARTEDDVQPYTILTSEQIERSGAENVEDFLKQYLTMNTSNQSNSQTYASYLGATSSINLRGLGANETLVLIDGRRSAGVNSAETSNAGIVNQPDINGIPLSAIERIEVLPSSASAIYGGAAVGGVVNVVLKKDFEGGDFRYTYDKPMSSAANQRTVSGSYGMTFGHGDTQILVGGQYSDGSPLTIQDRLDLVGGGINTILQNSPSYLYSTLQPFEGATPNVASATAFVFVPVGTPGATCFGTLCFVRKSPDLTLKPQFGGASLGSPITSIPAGSMPGADLSSGLLANAGHFDFNLAPGNGMYGLQNTFGTVPTTKSIFATLRQTIFDDVRVFAEFSTSSNASGAVYNPFSAGFSVPSSAPTNPFNQAVNITFPSLTAASTTTDSVTRSATIGLLAPITSSWSSELDFTWSRNAFEFATSAVDGIAFGSALSSGTVNPFADTIAYPLNLNTYLAPTTYSGDTTLSDLSLRVSGSMDVFPAGRASLTVGIEHRKESSGDADYSQVFPLTPANTTQEIFFGQSQVTDSLYVEALVPLVSPKLGIPAVHSLEFQLAGRTERYEVDAGTPYEYLLPTALQTLNPPQGAASTIRYTSTNPTVGLKYQPWRDITARVSYSSAFLPPTAAQLLSNPSLACGSSPCQQVADPVTGQSYAVNYTSGGNPKLRPQTSRDVDVGMIWEPQQPMLQGARIDVEYYRIVQPNYITAPTVQQVLSDPALAGRVTRDPSTGLITVVDTSYLNATEYKTSGFDVALDYRHATRVGTVGFRANGSWIKYDLRQYEIGSPFIEYAGFPNDGGEAKIKANATVDWTDRGWTAAWTTSFYSAYRQIGSPGSPFSAENGSTSYWTDAQGGFGIPSQLYHDVYISYLFRGTSADGWLSAVLSKSAIQFGVRNVFNRRPPFDAFLAPYFYSTYGDARLRDYRVTVSKTF